MKLGNDQLFSIKLWCGHLEHSGSKTCAKITKKNSNNAKTNAYLLRRNTSDNTVLNNAAKNELRSSSRTQILLGLAVNFAIMINESKNLRPILKLQNLKR